MIWFDFTVNFQTVLLSLLHSPNSINWSLWFNYFDICFFSDAIQKKNQTQKNLKHFWCVIRVIYLKYDVGECDKRTLWIIDWFFCFNETYDTSLQLEYVVSFVSMSISFNVSVHSSRAVCVCISVYTILNINFYQQ